MGAATAAVMGVGIFVVQAHLDGRYVLDDTTRPVLSASLSTVVR